MSNIQKQHKISPAIAWLTIQKFIIFYCPLDREHTTDVFRVIFFISRRIHNEQNRTRSESNGEEKRTGTFAYEGEEDCIHRSYQRKAQLREWQ